MSFAKLSKCTQHHHFMVLQMIINFVFHRPDFASFGRNTMTHNEVTIYCNENTFLCFEYSDLNVCPLCKKFSCLESEMSKCAKINLCFSIYGTTKHMWEHEKSHSSTADMLTSWCDFQDKECILKPTYTFAWSCQNFWNGEVEELAKSETLNYIRHKLNVKGN